MESRDIFTEIKKIKNIVNCLLLIIIFLSPLLVMFFKSIPILIVNIALIVIFIFMYSYKVQFLLQSYIMTFHLEEFKEFQKENFFTGMTHQRLYIFIKSKYFKIKSNNDERLKEELEKYNRHIIKAMVFALMLIIIECTLIFVNI